MRIIDFDSEPILHLLRAFALSSTVSCMLHDPLADICIAYNLVTNHHQYIQLSPRWPRSQTLAVSSTFPADVFN